MDIFKRYIGENALIVPVGDLHIDADCDFKSLEEDIEEIRRLDAYSVFVGDIFDVGFFDHIRDMQERDETLNVSMRKIRKLLTPIKDKILCVVEGNHDRRISKKTGFDIVEELTDTLGVPYAKGQAVLDLRLGLRQGNERGGRYSYVIGVTHGHGGGRTYGAKINKVVHWSDTWEGIDLFVMGHVHAPMSVPIARYVFDSRTGKIKVKEIHTLILSAYQKNALYAEQKLYPPSSQLKYKIVIEKNKVRIEEKI